MQDFTPKFDFHLPSFQELERETLRRMQELQKGIQLGMSIPTCSEEEEPPETSPSEGQ